MRMKSMAARKRRMARTMIAIWGNRARREQVSASRAERGLWGGYHQGYL